MSIDKSSIAFKPDYELDPEGPAKRYSVLDVNGNKEQFQISLWNGESMEFFLAHNVVELNSYFECLTDNGHAWTWGQRFKSLEHTLTGDALVNWKELMVEDYPDAADKTQPNYVKAIKDLITKLSDVTYPGEPLKEYMWKIVYSRCKDDQGKQLPPNKVFSRLKRMRVMGAQMHHNAPVGQPFISDTDFLKMFYNIFPHQMKTFVENMKSCDPFNGITTIDDVCDHFFSYYRLHLEDEKEQTEKRKRDNDDKTSESENEDEDNTSESENEDKTSDYEDDEQMSKDEDQESPNEEDDTDEEDNEKPPKKKDNDKSPKKKRKGTKGECPIRYHAENWVHSWTGCFCNPDSTRFDRNGADKFYKYYAKGDQDWYKHVYEAAFGEGGHGNSHFNNRGEDYNGHGNGSRGNGGRGNDDSSHYNQDDNYHYQGNNYYQGQHHSNGWRR